MKQVVAVCAFGLSLCALALVRRYATMASMTTGLIALSREPMDATELVQAVEQLWPLTVEVSVLALSLGAVSLRGGTGVRVVGAFAVALSAISLVLALLLPSA